MRDDEDYDNGNDDGFIPRDRGPVPDRDTGATWSGHPAGSGHRYDDDRPRVVGRISGLSAEVDADGEFMLVLHLESPAGRSQHGLTLTTENVHGLYRELGDCLRVLADVEALGAAADEVLRPFGAEWVDGSGDQTR